MFIIYKTVLTNQRYYNIIRLNNFKIIFDFSCFYFIYDEICKILENPILEIRTIIMYIQ